MFKRRANGQEYLDRPDLSERDALRSYRFMSTINAALGGTRIVREFVAEEARRDPGRPLRVLDLGAGACDIPLAVAAWARGQGLDVRFTCVDASPYAVELARARITAAREPAIKIIHANVFDYRPADNFDCATGSLFFHHLRDEEILRLLDDLRPLVRSVLISDLRRGFAHYLAALAASWPAGQIMLHDALLSVRRGFKVNQLRILLRQLGGAMVEVRRAYFMRVRAVVRFVKGTG